MKRALVDDVVVLTGSEASDHLAKRARLDVVLPSSAQVPDGTDALMPDCWNVISRCLCISERITMSRACKSFRRWLLPLHEFWDAREHAVTRFFRRLLLLHLAEWPEILRGMFPFVPVLQLNCSDLGKQAPSAVLRMFEWFSANPNLHTLTLPDGLYHDVDFVDALAQKQIHPIPSVRTLTLDLFSTYTRDPTKYLLTLVSTMFPAVEHICLRDFALTPFDMFGSTVGMTIDFITNWPCHRLCQLTLQRTSDRNMTISAPSVMTRSVRCLTCQWAMTTSTEELLAGILAHPVHEIFDVERAALRLPEHHGGPVLMI